MRRICAQIVEQQKRDAMATVSIASKNPASLAVEANQFAGRDLLSVLGKLIVIPLFRTKNIMCPQSRQI